MKHLRKYNEEFSPNVEVDETELGDILNIARDEGCIVTVDHKQYTHCLEISVDRSDGSENVERNYVCDDERFRQIIIELNDRLSELIPNKYYITFNSIMGTIQSSANNTRLEYQFPLDGIDCVNFIYIGTLR